MPLTISAIAGVLTNTFAVALTDYADGNSGVGTALTLASNLRQAITGGKHKSLNMELSAAAKKLEKTLPPSLVDGCDPTDALTACQRAILAADGSVLRNLLVADPSKAEVAALLSNEPLDGNDRPLAERLLAQSLENWQKTLGANPAVITSLREILAQHHNRLHDLATAGLDFGDYQSYIYGEDPPSALFRPERRVLTMIGRHQELKELQVWCNDETCFSARGLAAPGGTGKTRLALKLMETMQQQAWLSAFIIKQGNITGLSSTDLPDNMLLVLDYADYRRVELESAIAVAKTLVNSGKKIRLLLLARPDARWWTDTKRLLKITFYKQLNKQPPQLIALPSPDTRSLADAAQVLGQVVRYTPHDLPDDHAKFTLPVNGTPLMWMMAAYRFVQPNRQPASEEAGELCEDIVMQHERDYLCKKLGGDIYLSVTMQALALFTLAGGVDRATASKPAMKTVTYS